MHLYSFFIIKYDVLLKYINTKKGKTNYNNFKIVK